MQPGQTIHPGSEPQTPAEPPQPVTQPQHTPLPPAPQPAPAPPPPAPAAPSPLPAPEPVQAEPQPPTAAAQPGSWSFTNDDAAPPAPPLPASGSITWTASEFVSHDKNGSWYMLVMLGSVVLAGLVYFISRDLVSPIVVVIMGAAFAAFGARKPRVLEYVIDNSGVTIGSRLYPYAMFRTFSVIQEGPIRSILLMPLQRFNLQISLYYEPKDETDIISVLGTYLPYEQREMAAVDRFMHKIRF